MMDERASWLTAADPGVVALCWHGAEEVEHKSVAYDAFQAVHGGYFMRVLGLLAALVVTVKDLKPSILAWLERYEAGEDLSQISLSSLDRAPRGTTG